jgi:hypothetical protein
MSCGLPVPGPAEDFTVRLVTAKDVGVWYHVYNTLEHPSTNARTFAEGWGNTRFAPLSQADGASVHTYYAASTPESVYMESVLHDAALSPPGIFEVDKLRYYHLVTLKLPSPLQCVSFHTLDLPRLQHMTRAQLIDSLPACYPETRAWAQAAYLQRPEAQAIAYGSRRDDAGRCLLLFKQRMPPAPFEVLGEQPLAFGAQRAEVLSLVRSLDLNEV